MKRITVFLLFFTLCALFTSVAHAKPKDLPPDFSFATIDGKTIDFAMLKNGPVVMFVGSCWCPECKVAAPELRKASEEYKDKGVFFFCVMGNSGADEIRDFIETYRINFPVGKDAGIADAFGVRVIPQTLFFAKDGKFVKRIMGGASYREISKTLEKILELK